MNQEIKVMVNGEKRKIEVKPTDILLDVLRNKLGLKRGMLNDGEEKINFSIILE